jgi:hypothetical protein
MLLVSDPPDDSCQPDDLEYRSGRVARVHPKACLDLGNLNHWHSHGSNCVSKPTGRAGYNRSDTRRKPAQQRQ